MSSASTLAASSPQQLFAALITAILLLTIVFDHQPVIAFVVKPHTAKSPHTKTSTHHITIVHHAIPASEQDRLLLTEPAQTAFIVAEMRSFLTDAVEKNDGPLGNLTRWKLSEKDMLAANLIDENGVVIDEEYLDATRLMATNSSSNNNNEDEDYGKQLAINTLCNTTQQTFRDGLLNQPGLLSALGSAICYFREAFRTGSNLAACERIGLSDYVVAHHITDMYHHRNFRGAYTKTLTPFGTGEIAARVAVGLMDDNADTLIQDDDQMSSEEDEEDECILWSPTTPGVCIHWKSDDEAWRKKRFERIQMEGTKDPRRGGSGTTR